MVPDRGCRAAGDVSAQQCWADHRGWRTGVGAIVGGGVRAIRRAHPASCCVRLSLGKDSSRQASTRARESVPEPSLY